MKFFFLILSFCVVASGCVSDSKIEYQKEEIKIEDESILIDLSTFNLDSLDALQKIDSINQYKIIGDFPELPINHIYDRFEPLREYKELTLFENINSKLLLYHHPAWGNILFLLNYEKNGTPISGYELVSCGGDGGYYNCSKAKIEGLNCIISSEFGEPLSEDDYSKQIKTTEQKEYKFDLNFKLVIQDSTSHKDTL